MLCHFRQFPVSRPDAGTLPPALARLHGLWTRAAWTLIILVFALLLWVDLALPVGVAVVGYLILILIAAKTRLPLGPTGMAVVSTALVWAAHAAAGPAPGAWGWALMEPLAATATLWALALACKSWVRDRTALEATLETLAREQQDLTRANAGLERFAAVIAHDLRSPSPPSLFILTSWLSP